MHTLKDLQPAVVDRAIQLVKEGVSHIHSRKNTHYCCHALADANHYSRKYVSHFVQFIAQLHELEVVETCLGLELATPDPADEAGWDAYYAKKPVYWNSSQPYIQERVHALGQFKAAIIAAKEAHNAA